MGPLPDVGRSATCPEHALIEIFQAGPHLTLMARRPRPQLVTLSDAAADRVKQIMSEKGAGYLRVGVKNGGCAGMEYVMDYVSAPDAMDEIVEDKGVQIVVDAKAVLFLLGSVVDFETTALHEKFVFSNPNQTDACGCGESVTIVPAVAG
jgi:iron-sulfur cluster assembly protein